MDDTKKFLEQNPGSVIFARYASMLADEGLMQEAIDILEKGTRVNPFYATGHAVLGEVLFHRGLNERASESIRTALSLDPQLPADLYRLGRYLSEDSPEEALMCLDSALRYTPGNSEITELADQLRDLITPGMDLQLSERTEQALRDITSATDSTHKASIDSTEEDLLVALVSDEHDTIPENKNLVAEKPEDMFDFTGSGDEKDIAEDKEQYQIRPFDSINESVTETDDRFTDDIPGADRGTGFTDNEEKTVESLETPGQSENESYGFNELSDSNLDEFQEEIIHQITESGESGQIEVQPEEMTADISEESALSDKREDLSAAEAFTQDSEQSTPAVENHEPEIEEMAGLVDTGDDLSDDFLAYARMIETESVPDHTPTYDKLISGKFGEADDDRAGSSDQAKTPFDLDEEWLHAISDETEPAKADQENIDDGLDDELLDYIKLFEVNNEDKSASENDTIPVISIDESVEYNPAEYKFEGDGGEIMLSEEERMALESEKIEDYGTKDTISLPETADAVSEAGEFSALAGDLNVRELDELDMHHIPDAADEISDQPVKDVIDNVIPDGADDVSAIIYPDEYTVATPGKWVSEETMKLSDKVEDIPVLPVTPAVLSHVAVHEDELSINDLINDYLNTLNNEATLSDKRPERITNIAPPAASMPDLSTTPSKTSDKRQSSTPQDSEQEADDDDDITATIAEIYVSQGLIRKAVNIYRKLLARDPYNEAIHSRLAGLQQQLDRQSSES